MRTITMTYDEALEALQAAVRDRGADYRYADYYDVCRNFDAQGNPLCIVGHCLDQRGADEEFRNLHRGGSVHALVVARDLVVDARTKVLLYTAQMTQDDGGTWGAALQDALEAVKAHDQRMVRQEIALAAAEAQAQ